MADEGHSRRSGNDLVIPFLFVPDGQEPSPAWMAEHPEAVRFPARFVPHRSGHGGGGSGPADRADATSRNLTDAPRMADGGQAGTGRRRAPDAPTGAPPPGHSPQHRAAGNAPAGMPGDEAAMAPHRSTPRQARRPSVPPANADYADRLAAAMALERPGKDASAQDEARRS